MLDALSSLRGLLKVQPIKIDSHVFWIHYKLTTLVLLVYWLLTITSAKFFGGGMDCDFPDVPGRSLNTYCHIHGTFLVKPSPKNPVRRQLPHAGVSGHTDEDTLKFVGYYQWLFVVVLVQAVLFYLPHLIWKAWEEGLMEKLSGDLVSPAMSPDCIQKNTDLLLEYFLKRLHWHNSYALKYVTCEVLNLTNVICQILFLNAFLGSEFRYYGVYALLANWREELEKEQKNPIEWLFPTVTKCLYKKYGFSGSVETRDGMCFLPNNATNQYMYVILWFWFHTLAAVSAVFLMWRIIPFVFRSLRLRSFRSTCNMNSINDVDLVFDQLWLGDWFVLSMLERNINFAAYKQLIFRLARSYELNLCSTCSQNISRPCSKCTPV